MSVKENLLSEIFAHRVGAMSPVPQKISIKIKTRKLATQIQVDKVSVYQYLNLKQLQKDRVLCNYDITLI